MILGMIYNQIIHEHIPSGIHIVDATNSETFKQFMEDIRRDHPKFYMVLDNASYHKSQVLLQTRLMGKNAVQAGRCLQTA